MTKLGSVGFGNFILVSLFIMLSLANSLIVSLNLTYMFSPTSVLPVIEGDPINAYAQNDTDTLLCPDGSPSYDDGSCPAPQQELQSEPQQELGQPIEPQQPPLADSPQPEQQLCSDGSPSYDDGSCPLPQPEQQQPLSAQNTPPIANNQSITVERDKPADIDLLTATQDGEQDDLTASIVSEPQIGGTVTINQTTGTMTYVPPQGYVGADSFTYKVTDTKGADSNIATVTITVTCPSTVEFPCAPSSPNPPPTEGYPPPTSPPQQSNTPPVAIDHTVTIDRDDQPVTINLGEGASDRENDNLTAAIVAQPSHGTLGRIVDNGTSVTVGYTPTLGFPQDSFTYKVTDTKGADSNIATVTITVTCPSTVEFPCAPSSPNPPPASPLTNRPPTAFDQSVNTTQNMPRNITLSGTDQDEKDTDLTATIVSNPSHGSLSNIDQSTGRVVYTPTTDYIGDDSFTFKVTDKSQADSSSATIKIDVQLSSPPFTPPSSTYLPGNHPPTALDQNVPMAQNEANQTITFLATDLDNDTLTASIVTNPSHGSLSEIDQDKGRVIYSPVQNYSATDSFTYKVNDGKEDSNVANITIAIPPSLLALAVNQTLYSCDVINC